MFGKVLREFIEEKYSNGVRFAEEVGISTGHLSDILMGRVLPKKDKLEIFIDKLQPLSEEKRKKLIREWALDKSEGVLREDFEKMESENKNMLEVLKEVKNEKVLLKEIEELKEYENFYNLFFKELNSEETKAVLNAMVKELKVMSIDSPNSKILKEKFEKLEKIISEI